VARLVLIWVPSVIAACWDYLPSNFWAAWGVLPPGYWDVRCATPPEEKKRGLVVLFFGRREDIPALYTLLGKVGQVA
jgi:hypothetical protein